MPRDIHQQILLVKDLDLEGQSSGLFERRRRDGCTCDEDSRVEVAVVELLTESSEVLDAYRALAVKLYVDCADFCFLLGVGGTSG